VECIPQAVLDLKDYFKFIESKSMVLEIPGSLWRKCRFVRTNDVASSSLRCSFVSDDGLNQFFDDNAAVVDVANIRSTKFDGGTPMVFPTATVEVVSTALVRNAEHCTNIFEGEEVTVVDDVACPANETGLEEVLS
jgi:hypothetical protein